MKRIKDTSKVYIYFIILSLVQMFISPIIFGYFYKKVGLNIGLANSAAHFLTFIPCAIIFILLNSQSFKETLELRWTPIINIFLAVVIGFLAQPVMSFLSSFTQLFVKDTVGAFVEQVTPLSFGAMFFAMAVTPAITEEITLRGVILYAFKNKNVYVAAAINGLLFGIFHFNLSQFLYAFAIGFVLAVMVRACDSIFVSMVCHMTINGIQVYAAKISSSVANTEAANQAVNITMQQRILATIYLGVLAVISSILIAICISVMRKATNKYKIRKYQSRKSVNDFTLNLEMEPQDYRIHEENWKLIFNPWMIIILLIYILYILMSYGII